MFKKDILNLVFNGEYIKYEFVTKNGNRRDCLMSSEILFQDLALAHLTDLKLYCKVFLRVIKISPLEACLVS